MQFVFIYDFVGYVGHFHSSVFRSLEGRHEVEVGEVGRGKSCSVGRNDAVEEYFYQQEISSRGANVVGIVNKVAAKSGSDAVGNILFLCELMRQI